MENRNFVGVSNKEKKLGIIIILPTYFLFGSYIISFLFLKILKIGNFNLDQNSLNVFYNFFYDGVLLVLCIVILKDFIRNSLNHFKKYIFKDIIWATTIGILLLYSSQIASSLITSFIVPETTSMNQDAIIELLGSQFILTSMVSIIMAPILEELIFRGIIFSSFYEKNRVMAHIISALIFGLLHIINGLLDGELAQLAYLIPYSALGFVFSYVYEKKGNIIIPIYLHMLNNLLSTLIIAFL